MIACTACPKVPTSAAEVVVVAIAGLTVAWALFAAVRYTVRPGEAAPDHVKRRILSDDDGVEEPGRP